MRQGSQFGRVPTVIFLDHRENSKKANSYPELRKLSLCENYFTDEYQSYSTNFSLKLCHQRQVNDWSILTNQFKQKKKAIRKRRLQRKPLGVLSPQRYRTNYLILKLPNLKSKKMAF